jgi:hypothetical protein
MQICGTHVDLDHVAGYTANAAQVDDEIERSVSSEREGWASRIVGRVSLPKVENLPLTRPDKDDQVLRIDAACVDDPTLDGKWGRQWPRRNVELDFRRVLLEWKVAGALLALGCRRTPRQREGCDRQGRDGDGADDTQFLPHDEHDCYRSSTPAGKVETA